MAKKRKPRRTPGSGTIRKIGKRFKAAYPNPDGGHWTKQCDTLAEAEAWLAQFAQRKEQRLSLPGGQQTLGAWLETWLAARPSHLKPTTRQDYAYKLGMLAALAETPLADVTVDAVDAALRALVADGISEATVRQVRGLLQRALQEAIRREYILRNAAIAERTSRPPRKPRTRLSAHQARVLCDTATGFYSAAWPLLVCCGLRAGELCGLRLGDVDLDACVLRVRQVVSDLRGAAIIQDTPKTPASVREVPFPRAHAAALRQHLSERARRAERGAARETWQEHTLLFPGRSGRPLNPTSLRHALRDVTDAARLPPVTTHELRHTCAGLLERLDAPDAIMAGILGHGPKTITRHYAPPSVDTMRPWVERVWAAVFGEAGAARRVG